jgi:hypothetical protein
MGHNPSTSYLSKSLSVLLDFIIKDTHLRPVPSQLTTRYNREITRQYISFILDAEGATSSLNVFVADNIEYIGKNGGSCFVAQGMRGA